MATLYIVRGLPGSGKTTLARRLVRSSRQFEADMFFVEANGLYKFDPNKRKDAHEWCQKSVANAMQEKEDVAVSNTFSQRWEYQPYLNLAKAAGFNVQVIECHADWLNIHGVPEDVIQAMRERWEPHSR